MKRLVLIGMLLGTGCMSLRFDRSANLNLEEDFIECAVYDAATKTVKVTTLKKCLTYATAKMDAAIAEQQRERQKALLEGRDPDERGQPDAGK